MILNFKIILYHLFTQIDFLTCCTYLLVFIAKTDTRILQRVLQKAFKCEGCLFLIFFFLLMNLLLLTKKISVYFILKKKKISSQNIANNFVMCFKNRFKHGSTETQRTHACHL
jgi:hypothetical protein